MPMRSELVFPQVRRSQATPESGTVGLDKILLIAALSLAGAALSLYFGTATESVPQLELFVSP